MRDKKFNPTQGFHSLERKNSGLFPSFFQAKIQFSRVNLTHWAETKYSTFSGRHFEHNFYNKNIDTLIKFQWNIHKMKTYGIIIWYNQMNLSNLYKNGIVWTIFIASCWHYNYRKYWIFIHLKWTQLQQLTITSLVHSSKLDQVCNCF